MSDDMRQLRQNTEQWYRQAAREQAPTMEHSLARTGTGTRISWFASMRGWIMRSATTAGYRY